MPTSQILLDQLKTPIAILFDKINIRNNTELNYLDFDLSEPVPVQIYGSTDNTKTTVIPKLGSSFYKTQDIFYKRLELSEILINTSNDVIPSNELTLYDLLPKINTAFGINLLQEDVYDTPLPVIDSNSVLGMVVVTVVAKPTSFLFTGAYNLPIGPKPQDSTAAPYDVAYFVHIKGYQTQNYLHSLVSINTDGTKNTDFSLLRNAVSVENFTLDRVIILNNGNLVLNGNFSITIKLGQDTTANPVTCRSLTLNTTGAVISTSDPYLFHPNLNTKYYTNALVDFKYVIDAVDLTTRTNGIYRYLQEGTLDTNFDPSVIQYIPTLLSVCDDGKIYVVSPVFTAPLSFNNNVPSKQIRIDRININGTLDNTFSPVIISGNGSDNPLPVVSILPIDQNGFWMVLQPSYGVSSTSVSPVVNGQPSVPGNNTEVYSWNPIFRVSQSGAVNTSFSKSLKNHLDKSIFNFNGSNLNISDNVLIADNRSVTFFTYKNNPVTGYEFRQPLILDNQGSIKYLTGSEYEQQWRWVYAKEILEEPDGKFVSFGRLSVRAIDGSYGPVNYCIAKYKKTGAIDSLIYSQATSTTLNEQLILADVISYKK